MCNSFLVHLSQHLLQLMQNTMQAFVCVCGCIVGFWRERDGGFSNHDSGKG